MEENLMEKFQEKLKELLVIAKKKKNVLEYSEITDLFSDMNLTAEQMDSILEYLEKNNIHLELPMMTKNRILRKLFLMKKILMLRRLIYPFLTV